MNKFFSRSCLPDTVPSDIGSIDKPIYEEKVINGSKRLVVTGKENLKEFIETSKAETLIYNIINRFERGDVNVLSKVQGFYGDVTGMPSNLQEAQNTLISLENKFNSMPVDFKLKFGNSFNKFLNDSSKMSSEDFISLFKPELKPEPKPELKPEHIDGGAINE